jgi:glutamyl-tRNA synthetase/nondiscriminating glutamyl-tRNA synthetase
MGILPQALANYLALLGWGAEGGTREIFTREELIAEFKLERVTPSPAVFDWDKLHWLNRQAIKHSPLPQLRALAWPYFTAIVWLPPQSSASDTVVHWFDRVLELFLPAVDQLQQLPEKAAALWRMTPEVTEEDAAMLTSQAGERVVRAFTAKIRAEAGAMTPQRFKELMNEVKAETGVKGKDLFHPVRIILTGAHSGPEFDKLIPLLEDGSRLDLPTHVLSVRERVEAFAARNSQPGD